MCESPQTLEKQRFYCGFSQLSNIEFSMENAAFIKICANGMTLTADGKLHLNSDFVSFLEL